MCHGLMIVNVLMAVLLVGMVGDEGGSCSTVALNLSRAHYSGMRTVFAMRYL